MVSVTVNYSTETLIPFFKWSNSAPNEELLEVTITNKRDLKDVTGNLYAIKLKGIQALIACFLPTERYCSCSL